MQLGVGAVTRRVVEEASRLQVPQIVASRRQIDCDRGYLDWDQYELVEKVFAWSKGKTKVVRDHGGPTSANDQTFLHSLMKDVDAGFDVLHLDVCKVPHTDQLALLGRLCNFLQHVDIEVGGEREPNEWNAELVKCALRHDAHLTAAVIAAGGHVWNDGNIGYIATDIIEKAGELRKAGWRNPKHWTYDAASFALKAHNMDWLMGEAKQVLEFMACVDIVNIAPEFADVEIDAWLRIVSAEDAIELLAAGYDSGGWSHWFADGEGSLEQRARCGLRYALEQEPVRRLLARYDAHEDEVRRTIREAIGNAC